MKMLNQASIALLLVAATTSVFADSALPEQVIAAKNEQVQASLNHTINGMMDRSLDPIRNSDGYTVSGKTGQIVVEEIITVSQAGEHGWPLAANWLNRQLDGTGNVLRHEDDGSWKLIFRSWN